MTERLLLRIEDVSERLQIGRTRAWQLVASGQLPAVRIGRSVRVPAEALETYVRRLSTGNDAGRRDASNG